MELNYYAVTVKCGHVGKRYYIPITFGVKAQTKKEAASIARNKKRVKHDHSDCILDVSTIDELKYLEIKEENEKDEYLKCKNIQDQRTIDIYPRLVKDKHYIEKEYDKDERIEKVEYKMKKIKIYLDSFRNLEYA